MPESLRVELAEREVQCGDSYVDTYAFPEAFDMADFWSSSMAIACDDTMGLNPVEDPSQAQLVISAASSSPCQAYASVPVAVDAAAFALFLPETYDFILSPKLISEIYSGAITNWSDPRIQELNPLGLLPDLPIEVVPTANGGAIVAMETWLSSELGEEVDLGLTPEDYSEVDYLYEMPEGALKLSTFSAIQIAGATFANMITEEGNPDSLIQLEVRAVQTAVGQTALTGSAPNLSFTYDPSIPAQPLPGQLEVVTPWGAVFATNLYLCGEDSLATRFAARYLLRLDAQGSIANSVFSALVENVRVAAIDVVDEGLPEVLIPEEAQS
jgi:phosphate transport system substrate-binding protein